MHLLASVKSCEKSIVEFMIVFIKQEREKKKEEKKQRAEYLKTWSKPRDDMECDDLKVDEKYFAGHSKV